MLTLYRLSESQAEAASLVGVDDIERRQHVHQLTHRVLAGCKRASQPFTWLRAAGLRDVTAALAVGLEDGQALTSVLEATYSQVLEAILSTLDRDLIPSTPGATALAALCQPPLSPQQQQQQQQQQPLHDSTRARELLSAVGRFPAGYAPAAASSEELQEAFTVLQALCLLHAKARALLCKAQYLQLVTARACEVPACLPAAMNTLLTLLQGNEEAQALFVSSGGLDMLLTRTLQHIRDGSCQHSAAGTGGGSSSGSIAEPPCSSGGSNSSSSSGSGSSGGAGGYCARALAVQLLLFLQLLEHWVIAEAVNKGAHPSTQRSALALMVDHLGPDVAAVVHEAPLPADQPLGGMGQAATAAARPAGIAATGLVDGQQQLLEQRAREAADKLLRRLQAVAE